MPRSSFNTGSTQSNVPVSFGGEVPTQLLIGTDEQEAIWNELINGERNIIVNACAGSGKTTTGVQYFLREKRKLRSAFVAFNRHIADELTARLAGTGVEAKTYHQLGLAAIKQGTGKFPKIDKWKVYGILDRYDLPVEYKQEKLCKSRIAQLASLAKQYGIESRKDLEFAVDRHDLDLNGMEEVCYEYVDRVLKRCAEMTGVVDFDDMIWLPWKHGFKTQPYDVMLVDEAQDTNLLQQQLALACADRLAVVGDRNQAIYAFRGADAAAMDRMKSALGARDRGVVELGLPLTRRCPKSHVRLAASLVEVGSIAALDTALEGTVRHMSVEASIEAMAAGDMVVCRVNADLLMVAYKLLQRGVKAVIRGRDVGQGIVKLIDQAEEFEGVGVLNVAQLIHAAVTVTGELVNKFAMMPNGRGEMRASAAEDRFQCLVRLCEGVRDKRSVDGGVVESTSVHVKAAVEQLFADFETDGRPKQAVILGTIHKTKGLEAVRGWILRADLLPHPMARKEEDRAQEKNCAYIAVTRAKEELVFVGKGSVLFDGLEG